MNIMGQMGEKHTERRRKHAVRISHRDADSQKDIARIRLDEASQRTVDREGRNEIRRRAAKENMSTFRRKATVRDRLRDAKTESSPTQSSPPLRMDRISEQVEMQTGMRRKIEKRQISRCRKRFRKSGR